MTDTSYAPIEVESLGVGVYGHGEVGGLWRLMEGGEEGARGQCWFAAAPEGGYILETLFLLTGCIRLALAVLLVYGSPLELY